MDPEGVLVRFARNTNERFQKFGWLNIIIMLLPILIELLDGCRNRESLKSFVEGRRTRLQLAGLWRLCRRCVQEAGISGVFRVIAATRALYDSVLAECDDCGQNPGKMADAGIDPYQQALDEAATGLLELPEQKPPWR